MPAYRVYLLDGAGKITTADWIDAKSDEEALRQARSLQEEGKFELWDRQRLVGRFDSSPRFSPTQG